MGNLHISISFSLSLVAFHCRIGSKNLLVESGGVAEKEKASAVEDTVYSENCHALWMCLFFFKEVEMEITSVQDNASL